MYLWPNACTTTFIQDVQDEHFWRLFTHFVIHLSGGQSDLSDLSDFDTVGCWEPTVEVASQKNRIFDMGQRFAGARYE